MDANDLDAITTPQELVKAILSAQKERAEIGDPLAAGTVKALEYLSRRANEEAWHGVGQ
jgi:hypothetical protein